MHGRSFLVLSLLFTAVFLAGCPSGQILSKTPTIEDADDQQATCKIAKDPLNPLVVEWPGTSKVDFESSSKRGVVVVSYVGCNMKILSGCQAEGAYDFQAVTPARDRLEMKNQNELYARLPLAAASLKGELSTGSALELDYIAVGQRIADKPPVTLSGQCEGATHYVRTITVGAFKLDALSNGKAGASVEVGNAGGGIGREENARKLRSQGDVEKCAADSGAPECGATLQLGLAPLSVGRTGTVTSAGFGAGVGPLGVVPTVSTMTDVSNVGVGSLKDVDLAYLDLVQAAKRADKDASMPAENKAAAWDTLSHYPGTNPLRETAEKRREEWQIVSEAEARRRANLEKLRGQFSADKEKLDKLTSLDDDVVPKDQKDAYRKEFEQVYKPFESDLREIGAIASPSAPGSTDASSSSAGNSLGIVPSSDSDSSSGSATDDPSIGEQVLTIKAEFGAHAQSFSVDTENNDITGGNAGGIIAGGSSGDEKPSYDFGDIYVGGELDVNFVQGDNHDDPGVGVMLLGRYHLRAKMPNFTSGAVVTNEGGTSVESGNLNPNDDPTGAFALGGGLRLSGNIGDRVGLNIGLDFFISKFLNPNTTVTCGGQDWDPGLLGGAADLFMGIEYYPLQFLSLGIGAAIGFGHAGGQWCVVDPTTISETNPRGGKLVDVSADSFSATGRTQIGVHF